MKTTKKFLAIILAILMMVSIIPITAGATEIENSCKHVASIIPEFAPTETTPGLTASVVCSLCDETLVEKKVIPALGTTDDASVIVSGTCGTSATWTFNTETGALIISGTGAMAKYKSAQNRPWENYKNKIKSIIINEGITKIDNYAFRDCTNLLYASIPNTVTTIVNYVFRGCSSLASITIPDSVTSLGSEVFKSCTSLVNVTIGKGVSSINDNTFYGCKALINITIPDSVCYIYTSAFEKCSNLKSITLGKNLVKIDNKAFNSCSSLTDIFYAGTEKNWSEISIGTNNTPLENATIHFGSIIGDDGETHKHEYEIELLKPTCTEPGYLKYTCDCGEIYTENYPAFGHTKVAVAPVLPTTTEPGHTRCEKCSTCGEVYGGVIVPVLPNEESYAEFQSSDDFIGVTDELASTFTIYGNGPIENDDGFSIKYYIDTIIIADGITGIGGNACYRWGIGDTIIIGDSVKSIGVDAFRECEYKTIIIGDGVETIGADAFWASCIETIEFGKSVQSIGTRIFYGCDDLKSVTVDSENPYITIDEQGVIYNKDKTKVVLATDYLGVKDYVLADTVQEISKYAFYCDSTIESISLPDTLKNVGKYAFHSCDDLETVYYSGTKEQWSSTSVADYNTKLLNSTFHFGNGELGGSCGDNAIWHLDETTGVFTVSGTGAMFDYLLLTDCPWNEYRSEIKTVVISDGITALGDNIFENCDNLTNVILSDTVKTVKGFECCDGLVNFTIPNTVTTIGDYAFYGCVNLTNVVIPNSVTSIGYKAFSNCNSLTSITVPDTVTELKYGVFLDCKNLKTAIIGNGVNTIYGAMFEGCINLESVTIGNNVVNILGYAFFGCKSLKTVALPEGVTSIGDLVFRGCTSLTDIIIPKTLTTIGVNAFANCESLTDVYYSGSEAEWNQIDIKSPAGGYELENATKHYNCSAHTHSYETIVIKPTCTERGYTTYTCVCGNSYVDNYVDATGHSYTSEITTPATHTTTGVMTYTCACGDTYTEVIAKIEKHNYESVVTAPTCTEQGYTTYTCECGDSYVDYYVDALGHTEETIPAVAPTCTETGLTEGVKCLVCNETLTEQEELPANGHDYNDAVTTPTCTEQGYTTYTCECGDSYVDDYVEALGHSPANAVEENYVAPTCTSNGSKDIVVYCSECDEELSRTTETIEMLSHADNDGDGYCDADNELLDPSVECDCNCHKSGITKFFFDFILFFQRIFGSNKTCDCGIAHY